MFAPLIFVFLISSIYNKFGFVALVLAFLAFSALMGISLSNIFYMYPVTTIAGTFVTSAVVFGVMAVGGYITHQDLTKFGSIMIMLLIGIVVATILNLLIFHSGSLDLIISYVGVAVL
jgi:FtsH-binding integral membrane protein